MLNYRYIKRNEVTNQETPEKDSYKRSITIQDPIDYTGDEGAGIFIVNGCAVVNDGNFLGAF